MKSGDDLHVHKPVVLLRSVHRERNLQAVSLPGSYRRMQKKYLINSEKINNLVTTIMSEDNLIETRLRSTCWPQCVQSSALGAVVSVISCLAGLSSFP